MDQISLFYSYAPADATLRDELAKHLSILRLGGFIAEFYDRDISAGTEWEYQIHQHLNMAHIILLLISSDFLASPYCYSTEMKRALERFAYREARVIPILLRPVDWQAAPFARLQVLPQNGNPVTTWVDRDSAFTDIAIHLRRIVNELRGSRVNILSDELSQSSNSQAPQRSSASEQTDGNVQKEYISPQNHQARSEFRLRKKKVYGLKSVHNMLHEVEVQLVGLSATIQLFTRGKRGPHLLAFEAIEIAWRQAVLKIGDLVYFAADAEAMETLGDIPFSLDSDVVSGAPWVIELFILQRPLDAEIENRNLEVVKKLSNELLTKCRTHLYRIDKRLLDAVKELDLPSDLISL